ncbi:hypothetical protein MTP10_07230 [Nonomuraea sp. 3-1Str]|uniref:hypothetical protein n=1 Tax=Nonomuraea sp. 3-1Str TaxID=2929801 RepID=UPI002855B2D5|nr:hypothetical protein [Nonomuraea sp. 3-1Str]MDR8408527.1 hypothetical protein [Nonomuraea sp. 3-1Str]
MLSSCHGFADADPAAWIAYVDESESNQRLDPHVYILASVIVQSASAGEIRQRLVSLRLGGQRKVHWVKESACRRMEICELLEGLGVLFVIVLHEGDPGASAERRRRKCLDLLLWELSRAGVTELILESREASQNRKDRSLVDALLARRQLPVRTRVHHLAGAAEPLLWAADWVAGAMVSSRTGDDTYLKKLDGCLEIHRTGP